MCDIAKIIGPDLYIQWGNLVYSHLFLPPKSPKNPAMENPSPEMSSKQGFSCSRQGSGGNLPIPSMNAGPRPFNGKDDVMNDTDIRKEIDAQAEVDRLQEERVWKWYDEPDETERQ